MRGYVAKKGNRWYAVIYDGLDPVTGRERRRWHPAGVDRAGAERLAKRLATAAAPCRWSQAARTQDRARGPPHHPPRAWRRSAKGSAPASSKTSSLLLPPPAGRSRR